MGPLVSNPFLLQNIHEGHPRDLQVQGHAFMIHVVLFVFHFHRDRKVIPAVHLCPTRNTGNESMNPFFRPEFNEVILVEKGWPRPDKAHVTFQDTPQLRQFVQTEFSEEGSDGRQVAFRVLHQVGGHLRSIQSHRTKLGHPEDGVVDSHPVGPV